MLIKFRLLVPLCLSFLIAEAQYTTDKVIAKKDPEKVDSLSKVVYPHLLPIWGEKVIRKGFDLPKSAGLSVQYVGQNSDLIIEDLMIGFNNGPMHNLDEIVRFNGARSISNGVNVRPDFWLFPFLNVYGILAKSKVSTEVDCGLWIPDSNGWNNVLNFQTKADFNATTYGFGLTPTVGISGYFLALDLNCTWSDIPELDDPAFVFVFGPRFGKNFAFEKPERNLAVWAGGFRVKLNSGTSGSLPIGDLFPTDEWQGKIDTGYMKVASSQQSVDAWWTGLTPTEQKNPVNIAKHETANRALTIAGNVLDAASQTITNIEGSSVQYSLTKRPKNKWNFIVGSQFQINKSWMLRAEFGFLGSRTQGIAGVQYRFNF